MPLLQIAQQLDDLLLHRPVERRGRLVEHHHRGLQDHGAGNGDALPLAARELMRIAVAHGWVESHLVERRGSPAVALPRRQPRLVHQQPLGDDLADRHARRQRPEGVLAARAASWRLSGRMACRLKPEMSRPSNRMMPSDGMSLSSARREASICLIPNSPTTPMVSLRRRLRLTPSTARSISTGGLKNPPPSSNVDRYLAAFENARRAARRRCLAALGLRRQQHRRIGIARMVEHRIGFAFLDHLARLHDIDPVGNPAHDAEIVGDEHDDHAEPLLQVAQAMPGSAPGS